MRHSVECGCERGGDCTKTSMCAMDSALQDQAEEYEARIAQLERDLHGQARAKIQLGRILSEERKYFKADGSHA